MVKVSSGVGPCPSQLGTRYRVRFSRLSVAYSIVFVAKLASTPLFAYLTEPWPWVVDAEPNMRSNYSSFAAFTQSTLALLRTLYNNETMPPDEVCFRNPWVNSHAVRKQLPIPPILPEAACSTYLVKFPGAVYYGASFREFVCTFLKLSSDERRTKSHQCHHMYLATMPVCDCCLWIEPIVPDTSQTGRDQPAAVQDEYSIYHAILIWENSALSWGKLGFRCVLVVYILRVLWTRYYRHYIALVDNLKTLGLHDSTLANSPRVDAYVVVAGDPSYLILHDPLVAVVMVADIWLGAVYFGLAIERVHQLMDVKWFILGCMYTSRFVWAGYLSMQALSAFAKRFRCESTFAPLDPGSMAVWAYVYGGPILCVIGNTRLLTQFQWLWDLGVSRERLIDSTEALPGLIIVSLELACIPVFASVGWQQVRRCHRRRVEPKPVQETAKSRPSRTTHSNDVAVKCVVALASYRTQVHAVSTGLSHLLETNPRYRRLPLLNHRGADCCVVGMAADGSVRLNLRLSLRDCLDMHANDPALAVALCDHDHSKSAMCRLGHRPCTSSNATLPAPNSNMTLHGAANNCQWIHEPND